MPEVVYIDSQSYNNLSLYDLGMLSEMEPDEVVLFGSTQWDCKEPKVKLYKWFNYNNKKNPILKGLSYLATICRIAFYIRKHKEIKIVHIQWLRLWHVDILFARWLKRRGIKIVFTAHNLLPHDSGDTHRKKYAIYYKIVEKICVHSEATRFDLIRQFEINPNKVEVIPHGIIYSDVPEETIILRAESLKKKYGINQETLVISSLGIQSYYKGVDILIDLWGKNKELNSNPNVRLMIIGKNKNLDYTPIQSLDNVVIIDEKIPNEDFQAFLEISDVVLLPYRKISQSGVLFSAIARNKPVVISNVGGLPDPLNIGKVGWNIGPVSENSLKRILLDLVKQPEIVKSFGQNNIEFKKVKEHYSWKLISITLKRLYDKLII